MNIFKEYTDILGEKGAGQFKDLLPEIHSLANSIRAQLGEQGYLLDRYMAYILDAAAALSIYTAAESGQMTGCVLRRICSGIMRQEAKGTEHPFYERAKSYIDAHPLPYKDHYARLDIYYLALCDEFYAEAMQDYFDELHHLICQIDMQDLYGICMQIEGLLGGGEQMERLGLLMRQRFFKVTAMAAFLQGLTDDLMSSLTRRDIESSRQMFQLWLDRPE